MRVRRRPAESCEGTPSRACNHGGRVRQGRAWRGQACGGNAVSFGEFGRLRWARGKTRACLGALGRQGRASADALVGRKLAVKRESWPFPGLLAARCLAASTGRWSGFPNAPGPLVTASRGGRARGLALHALQLSRPALHPSARAPAAAIFFSCMEAQAPPTCIAQLHLPRHPAPRRIPGRH